MESITVKAEDFTGIAKRNPEAVAKFEYYYKYYFYLTTYMEGYCWRFAIGGESDDIYRLEVVPETLLKDILQDYTPQFIKIC